MDLFGIILYHLILLQAPVSWGDQVLLTNRNYSNPSPVVTFYTHPSSHWDDSESARQGLLELGTLIEKAGIPSFLMAAPRHLFEVSDDFYQAHEDYYLQPGHTDNLVFSVGGEHQIFLPKAQTLIFGGGRFLQCLGETVRDALQRSDYNGTPIEAILVSDAIYRDQVTLEESLENKSMEEVLKEFLKFIEFDQQTNIQNLSQGSLVKGDFQFSFEYQNRRVGSFGQGDRHVQLRILSFDQLRLELPRIMNTLKPGEAYPTTSYYSNTSQGRVNHHVASKESEGLGTLACQLALSPTR